MVVVRVLSRFSWPVLLLFLLPSAAAAQSETGHGYLFAAPGGKTGLTRGDATLHAGLGGEAFVFKGLALGGEIGVMRIANNAQDSSGQFTRSREFLLSSINAAYHFGARNPDRRWVPFLTGGLSLLNAGGGFVNYGGGVDYWFRKRVGLRLAFRDHVDAESHLWQVRIGVTFR